MRQSTQPLAKIGHAGMALELYPDRIEHKAIGARESIPLARVSSIALDRAGLRWVMRITAGMRVVEFTTSRKDGEVFRDAVNTQLMNL